MLYSATRSESLNEVVRRRILAGNYFLMKWYGFSNSFLKFDFVKSNSGDKLLELYRGLQVVQ